MKLYKNRPIIRKDNTIYYGSMADKYIAMLQILSTKESFGETVSDKILIQVLDTNEKTAPKDAVIKASEKHGLFESLDIADIWLTRALKSE